MGKLATLAAISLLVAGASTPKPAYAGLYGDDLTRCLVSNTTDDDKIVFARWIFTVIAVHPSAASMAVIPDATRIDIAKNTASLFEKLLTETCKDQTANALKYDGDGALGDSFKVLGEMAMTTLLGDPGVKAESENFGKYIDEAKFKAAFGKE